MPKSTNTCNALLQLIFNATTWTGIAQNAGSPITSLYLGLHTGDPGLTDDQTVNEVTTGAYASYARLAVARTSGGWTVSTNTVSNAALAQFPACTGGSGASLTYVAIGTAASAAGHVIYKGALNSPLAVSNGIQPQFAQNALVLTET